MIDRLGKRCQGLNYNKKAIIIVYFSSFQALVCTTYMNSDVVRYLINRRASEHLVWLLVGAKD